MLRKIPHSTMSFCKIQECIPVGRVPSAAVAVSPAQHTPLPCTPPTTHAHCHAHTPHHACPLSRIPLPCMPLLPYMPPPRHTHSVSLPCTPPDRMTDACENITFLQLLLRTVKTILLKLKEKFNSFDITKSTSKSP